MTTTDTMTYRGAIISHASLSRLTATISHYFYFRQGRRALALNGSNFLPTPHLTVLLLAKNREGTKRKGTKGHSAEARGSSPPSGSGLTCRSTPLRRSPQSTVVSLSTIDPSTSSNGIVSLSLLKDDSNDERRHHWGRDTSRWVPVSATSVAYSFLRRGTQ